jgi:hypothetical protein
VGGDDLGLPCRRDGAHPLHILASLTQRIIPLHQRRPHPLDRGGASRGLGALLRGQVQQGLNPVRQPPVRRPQSLDEGVQGLVLPQVPLKVGVEAVEGIVSLPGPSLQLLPPTSEARRVGVRKNTNAEKARKGTSKPHETQLTWKTRHAGPLWIRNASFSARWSEAPWSGSSCQSPCSA